ncbi:Neuropeptides B/W receptor type [Trichinella spiralis]|uniref:Neuropeptides B/W receptor type n=1 Tax=Trichinella spiralis TaxID=6334 RepID=A0ABR3KYL6_TRISP
MNANETVTNTNETDITTDRLLPLRLFFVVLHRIYSTVTNILILNLSAADTIYLLFLPLVISFKLQQTWNFGLIACKTFFISESTTKYSSVYFIALLSVDRYLSICFRKRNCRCQVTWTVLSTIIGWIMIASLMVPIYMNSRIIQISPTKTICTVAWPASSSSPRTNKDANYYVHLLRAKKRIGQHRKQHRRNKSYNYVTKMVMMIVGCYLICWTPYWVMNLTLMFSNYPKIGLPARILFNIIHSLPYINCAMNPLFYTLFTTTFKEALKKSCFHGRWMRIAETNTNHEQHLLKVVHFKTMISQRNDTANGENAIEKIATPDSSSTKQ